MLELVLIMMVFGALIRREQKDITGSPGLMTTVTVVIGLTGSLATLVPLIKYTDLDSMWVNRVLIFVWIGIGYGAYRFIQAKREKAFYDRLNE